MQAEPVKLRPNAQIRGQVTESIYRVRGAAIDEGEATQVGASLLPWEIGK